MEWLFRCISPDEVERDITSREQFDTDETRIQATLIRESHQNSLDARPEGSTNSVRTRVRFFEPSNDEDYFEALFKGLNDHLSSSGVDASSIDFRKPRFLLIEDFGTTGLTGAWDKKDKLAFSDFWRREGKSHKGGTSNGRWGLGKLVFSSASQIRTFFGLTIRADDPTNELLMGEAVLATHEIGEETFTPYGFYANVGPHGIQVPELQGPALKKFKDAVGVQRNDEAGFSVIIPYPLKELNTMSLIQGVIGNYFYPILTGELEVEIQGELISADTFDAVAVKYAAGNLLNSDLIAFIRNIHSARDQEPDVTLGSGWAQGIEAALDAQTLEDLRKRFAEDGKFVHVRAPIVLKPKEGGSQTTYFDLFLQKAPESVVGTSLFIRSTITVPQESKGFPATDTFAALLARDRPIATFLGDAENPAHTQWSLTAEKLREKWKAGPVRLGEVRKSLRELYKALAQLEERKEPDALIDFFSIEDTAPGKKAAPKIVVKVPIPVITPQEKTYRIARRTGGFAVRPGKSLSQDMLPMTLRVRTAYDVFKGNPLKRYDPLDFQLNSSQIKVVPKGANCTFPAPNYMSIEVTDTNFSVEVEGFDENRDLFIDARKEGK